MIPFPLFCRGTHNKNKPSEVAADGTFWRRIALPRHP
jgi:hypothetical protein